MANAGVMLATRFASQTPGDQDRMVDINVTGVIRTARGAFPGPERLAGLAGPQPGRSQRKLEQLQALGRAAADGRLSRERLRGMDPEEAAHGVGPFSAELILIRGMGLPDALPCHEQNFARAARTAYGLADDADVVDDELAEMVEGAIAERERLPSEGMPTQADAIRASLRRAGVRLEDTPDGVRWHRARERGYSRESFAFGRPRVRGVLACRVPGGGQSKRVACRSPRLRERAAPRRGRARASARRAMAPRAADHG